MFSILIVSRNRQQLLCRAINHICSELEGTDIGFELLVYDDCSDTKYSLPPDILKRTSLFHGDSRVGLIEARNILLRKISPHSEFIVLLDDDIFLFNLASILKTAADYLRKEYFIVSIPYFNLPCKIGARMASFKRVFGKYRESDSDVYFFAGSCIIKKELFERVGFFEGLYFIYLEEEDLSIRMFSEEMKIKTLYGFNFIGIHDQAGDKNFSERKMFLLSNRLLFHNKFIKATLLKYILNFFYICLYLFKMRDIGQIRNSISRYQKYKHEIIREPFPTMLFLKFLVKRYFIA